MTTKPIVYISEAYLYENSLFGTVHNYPTDHMVISGCVTNNSGTVRTSSILNREGDTIETQRTIYKVLSWHKDFKE